MKRRVMDTRRRRRRNKQDEIWKRRVKRENREKRNV